MKTRYRCGRYYSIIGEQEKEVRVKTCWETPEEGASTSYQGIDDNGELNVTFHESVPESVPYG